MTTPIAHEPGAGEGADFGAVRFSIKAESREHFFREVAAAIREDRFTTEFRDRLAEQLELTYYDDVTF